MDKANRQRTFIGTDIPGSQYSYDHLTEQRITEAQARLDLLREEKLWDAKMRPIRNVMARLRLKVREVGLDTVNMLETGYMLIKNPKWRSPLEERHAPG